jgi:glycosyltransferase involved in cell wall biosynthesis
MPRASIQHIPGELSENYLENPAAPIEIMENIFCKVLFIAPDDKYGGIGSVLRSYSKNMQGFKCVATYPSIPIKSKFLFFTLSVARLLKILATDKKIEIVHLHSASNGSFVRKGFISIIAKAFGKKTVFHLHGGAFKSFYEQAHIFKPLIRLVLKSSDKVICLSPIWYDFYSNTLKIDRLAIVPNPVELCDSDPGLRIGPTLTLLFLGKICDDKGIFDLITYLRTSQYFLDNKIKLLVGGVGEHERLQAIISLSSIGSKIEYHGWANECVKRQLLEESDIFILPSLYEGLPVSILEAMAYRKPIIANDVGGVSSIVKNGYNGWLLQPGDLKQLDNVFNEVFENRPLLYSYGLNSYREASKYSSKEVIKSLSDIYESLCAQ